jgi:hypothetical protein
MVDYLYVVIGKIDIIHDRKRFTYNSSLNKFTNLNDARKFARIESSKNLDKEIRTFIINKIYLNGRKKTEYIGSYVNGKWYKIGG